MHVDAALRTIRSVDHLDAEALSQREERDLVRDVVVLRRQDHVSARERNRRQGACVRVRGARREGDVVRAAAEELCRCGVEVVHPILPRVGRLVAADLRFELEVLRHRIEHGPRHQGGASVVEVDAARAARRV